MVRVATACLSVASLIDRPYAQLVENLVLHLSYLVARVDANNCTLKPPLKQAVASATAADTGDLPWAGKAP